jgi:hypothetical protein
MRRSFIRRLSGLLPKRFVGWFAYHRPGLRTTLSQFAEDVALARLLPDARGFYVDIGAFHPKFGSNTYLLWKRGWRGVNVDVDEYKMALFRRFRPDDTNLTIGISSKNGERNFYFQEGESYGSMSSFEPQFSASRGARLGRRVSSRVVPVRTLNWLLDQHVPRSADGKQVAIDLLNIDVEGHELELLRDFDFARYRPRCICVEIHAATMTELANLPTYLLLRRANYDLVAWPAPSCIFQAANAAQNTDTVSRETTGADKSAA